MFASSLGRWVDDAPGRLRTLLATIAVNRVVVIAACLCWAAILAMGDGRDHDDLNQPAADSSVRSSSGKRSLTMHHQWKDEIFLLILALGILDRLSRLANLISVERDWVPTIVGASTISDDTQQQAPYDLSRLNALMSRVDLVCKLGAPIAVSTFMSVVKEPWPVAVVLMGLNVVSWPLEYWTARKVWEGNERLRGEKAVYGSRIHHATSTERKKIGAGLLNGLKAALDWVLQYGRSLRSYFETDIWMPSLAVSSLHFSVLNFSPTLIVFLVNSGLHMTLITWAEVLSAAFEMSSTFLFPWAVHLLGNEYKGQIRGYQILLDDEDERETTDTSSAPATTVTPPLREPLQVDDETTVTRAVGDHGANPVRDYRETLGIERLGMTALAFTLVCLILSLPAIWSFSSSSFQPASSHPGTITALVIIFSISTSRLPRFMSVLCSQQLAQTCVQPARRSTFAGTEAGIASAFGLLHYVTTAVWSRHEEFGWVALGSVAVIAGAVGLYGIWFWRVVSRTSG